MHSPEGTCLHEIGLLKEPALMLHLHQQQDISSLPEGQKATEFQYQQGPGVTQEGRFAIAVRQAKQPQLPQPLAEGAGVQVVFSSSLSPAPRLLLGDRNLPTTRAPNTDC